MSFRLSRRGTVFALTGVLSATAFAASAVPANAATSPPEQLANYYTTTCLDGGESAYGLGNVALLDSCVGGYQPEYWKIVTHSGYVQIELADWPSYCLDGVEGTNGVTAQKCLSGDLHQRWIESNPISNSGIGVFEDANNQECLDGTLDYGVRVMPCGGQGASNQDPHQWWTASS